MALINMNIAMTMVSMDIATTMNTVTIMVSTSMAMNTTTEPVPVKAGVVDLVNSGCVNTSGQIKIRVEKILEESMVTRILDSVENAAASKPAIDKFITRFARVYTPFVVLIAFFVAVVLPFIIPSWHFFVDADYTGETGVVYGTSGTASVLTALTFLVISCPCALVLSVPLAFFSGIGAASKKNILFKGGIAIESLKNIKAVVMDKTGTITKGNFVVQDSVCADKDMTSEELLAISASCELSSTHPIGNSIVEAAQNAGLEIERPSKVKEIAGHGIRAEIGRGYDLDLQILWCERQGEPALFNPDGLHGRGRSGYPVFDCRCAPDAFFTGCHGRAEGYIRTDRCLYPDLFWRDMGDGPV